MSDTAKSELAARIRKAREWAGMEPEDLGAAVDVRGRSVYRWESGETAPYKKTLKRVASSTGVSERWLETGKGDMLLPGQGDGDHGEAPEVTPGEEGRVIEVPVFGRASCGPGLVPLSECIERYERLSLKEYMLAFRRPPPHNGNGHRLGFFEVEGRSAAPVYFDGELVPVEVFDPPTQQFTNDLAYVFRWDDQIMLKYLRRREDEKIEAQALNPAIDPFFFTPAGEHEFAVLGRVLETEKQQLYGSLVGRFLRL